MSTVRLIDFASCDQAVSLFLFSMWPLSNLNDRFLSFLLLILFAFLSWWSSLHLLQLRMKCDRAFFQHLSLITKNDISPWTCFDWLYRIRCGRPKRIDRWWSSRVWIIYLFFLFESCLIVSDGPYVLSIRTKERKELIVCRLLNSNQFFQSILFGGGADDHDTSLVSPYRLISLFSSPVHCSFLFKSSNFKEKVKSMADRKLFIGNLVRRITQDDLWVMYSTFGPLEECAKFHESFGFVRFLHAEDARRALDATHGISLKGRCIKVEFAATTTSWRSAPNTCCNDCRPTGNEDRWSSVIELICHWISSIQYSTYPSGGCVQSTRSPSPYRSPTTLAIDCVTATHRSDRSSPQDSFEIKYDH